MVTGVKGAGAQLGEEWKRKRNCKYNYSCNTWLSSIQWCAAQIPTHIMIAKTS
jgi:hypothetical protein